MAGSKSAAHSFAFHNDGQGTLAIDRVEIAGADLDQFTLSGDECTGATLAPDEKCLVRVRFAPDSAGAKAAKLRVRGDAATLASALSGQGEEPAPAQPQSPATDPGTPGTQPNGPPAATNTVTVITETSTAWLHRKHRIIRGQGIKAGSTQALRRKELRASAARR